MTLRHRAPVSSVLLILLLFALTACATNPQPPAAVPETSDAPPSEPAETKEGSDARPTVAKAVDGLERLEGLFTLYPDPVQGKLWLELPPPDERGLIAEVLWLEGLLTGLGSNPVGLDRGQMSSARLLEIRRIGPRVVFVQPNLRFVAESDAPGERLATRQSFAESVRWGAEVAALDEDGTSLVDLTSFVVRDAHGVARTLHLTEQGQYRLDPERSYLDFSQILTFPDNVEFEAVLTWANQSPTPPGRLVAGTAPDGDSVTLVQHQSLVRLPDDGYRPRRADPRMGFWSQDRFDYAVPLDDTLDRSYIGRHRLQKVDPQAAVSDAVEPIVYYVDHGAPEPIRSALLDGARWWETAFEAAGFRNAFRVEILPADAHPLDVRYNVIQWVHRSTRGWSYGLGVTDPRTGEIIKGHVSLGSLRVRQDRLLFEGLLSTAKTGSGDADDPIQLALARIRQLSAHEVGHTIGLAHNFAASTYADRASVMDYPAPLLTLVEENGERRIDTSNAYGVGVGAWDVHTIRWGYAEFPPDADEAAELEAIVREGLEGGHILLGDSDARPPGASDPRGNLWDNGDDAVDALASALAVRAFALERFGERNLPSGEPLAHLQEVLAPLYFHHRYQLDAAAKTLGGLEYHYAVRGDGQTPTQIVAANRQRRALDVILSILEGRTLDLPESVLRLLAPRPFGEGRNREMFASRAEPSFDALGAAATAADMAVRAILQSERLARVEDFHRRNREYPSVGEVMERLLNAAFAEESGERLRAIRRQVESVTVNALVDLASYSGAAPGVRAEAEFALAEAAHRLTRAEADAHADRLRQEIERFLDRPWQAQEQRTVDAPPPGSPIGTDLLPHASYETHCGFGSG
ncbi:MAG: zinc-dependent metalloprotease [Thermoanaerobaculia bacterium]|nr:zinc-dependent metalloprotease [Thermoanaerobaculia bacterium]